MIAVVSANQQRLEDYVNSGDNSIDTKCTSQLLNKCTPPLFKKIVRRLSRMFGGANGNHKGKAIELIEFNSAHTQCHKSYNLVTCEYVLMFTTS